MSTRRERRKPAGAAQGPPDVNDGSSKVKKSWVIFGDQIS